tara:strand:- start:3819 stop:4103 length:285 start_codon:yes stop_codon:yes gene_type:complete
MKKLNILSIIFLVQISCATLNRAQGEIHYNNNISKGQELQDLKKALDEGAINREEYNLMKEKIINDKYVKDLIDKFDSAEDEEDHRKASFNIEL